jgi:succinate dehydrogenase/fumarate reductase flavoprotein subunit
MSGRPEELDADLVVLGGGMAGMSAAGYAASRGASVCVIEKGAEIGGSAVLSGGWLWAAPTYEILRERAPKGDPELQRAFIERFPRVVEWVRGTEVEMSEERPILGFGRGYVLDILAYVRRCQAIVESAKGWVLRSTATDRLIVEDGRVCGVAVRDARGTATVRAPAVLVATGGFQGNPSLLYEQFGENARQLVLRSNPHSTGDGLGLGLAAGADVAGDMTAFYGHLIAWPLMEYGPKDFPRFGLNLWSLMGLVVNLNGERFTDESLGYPTSTIATTKQPHARAAVLVDEAGRRRVASFSTAAAAAVEKGGQIEDLRRAGAHVASSGTLEGIARSLAEWGFDVSRLPATIDAYNAMIEGGSSGATPGRRWNRHTFGEGPYLAFDVRPAIVATQGGLRVDGRSRVLDRQGQPIPGLFAAGADAGGFYNGGYCGSLSVGCVFGITAVETVLGAKLFDLT